MLRFTHILFIIILSWTTLISQHISDFIALPDSSQSTDFIIPSSHTFQRIMEHGFFIPASLFSDKNKPLKNILAQEDFTFKDNPDFTAYVPISRSNSRGYLGINHELTIGGMSVLDVFFDSDELWKFSLASDVDFSGFAGTSRNCSGGITPWGTIISCEETVSLVDSNTDGYNDLGWAVEIDPSSKTVIDKRWALGNFKHENAIIHDNQRTLYQGIDDGTGYLYKFVANAIQDLSSGLLYVYKGSKNGSGNWLLVPNTTIAERNGTMLASTNLGATVFNGIEDVDIGHDGLVYFAVKGESTIYRFQDSDPITGTTVNMMETYVGPGNFAGGLPGIDNLAFDCEGNLWALQDGGRNHIWLIKYGTNVPLIFGRTPIGSEPTGLTFTPDCRFGFISIQHPSVSNNSSLQVDAAENSIGFEKDISLVFARKEELGSPDSDCTSHVLDIPINSSSDDAEEKAADGAIYFNSTDIELVDDPGVNGNGQIVGLRFNNVGVPVGAKIKRAYVQFTVDETITIPGLLNVQAEAIDSSISISSDPFDLSSRSRTKACSPWPISNNWYSIGLKGMNQRSPDISAVIEEVTDRPGWVQNNSVLILISGQGKYVAESFDGDPDKAPLLHIEYELCNSDLGCESYGHKTLTGVFPINNYFVENELIIQGDTNSPNGYNWQAGKSIEFKPVTEITLGSTLSVTITPCRSSGL